MKPYYEDSLVQLYHGDCRELLPALVANVIVTDPPYGVTSLAFDNVVRGWVAQIPSALRVSGQPRSALTPYSYFPCFDHFSQR